MSDSNDFDFAMDLETPAVMPGEGTEAPTPEVTPPTATPSDQVTLSKSEHEALQRQLAESSAFQQRLQQAIQPQAQQGYNPESVLDDFIKDPNAVLNSTAQKATNEAIQQLRNEMIIEQKKQEYSELRNYYDYVEVEANQIINAHAQQGKYIPLGEAIDKAVTQFKAKFDAGLQGAVNKNESDAMKRMALQLDAKGSQPNAGNLDFYAMSDAEIDAFTNRLKKGA